MLKLTTNTNNPDNLGVKRYYDTATTNANQIIVRGTVIHITVSQLPRIFTHMMNSGS